MTAVLQSVVRARSDSEVPERPLSALPSPAARVLAFASIIVAGVAGALIGAGFVRLQCTGNCATPQAIGALIAAILAAAGTAVVAVLVMRAMGEWRAMQTDQASSTRPRD